MGRVDTTGILKSEMYTVNIGFTINWKHNEKRRASICHQADQTGTDRPLKIDLKRLDIVLKTHKPIVIDEVWTVFAIFAHVWSDIK